MLIYKISKFAAASAFVGGMLSGCSTGGPVPYQMKADADSVINRDVSGKSLSLVLRVYQLKSLDEFNRMTFDALVSGKSDAEMLGNSLVSRSEMILLPGKSIALDDKLPEEVKFVGVVGLFRKPDQQFWRAMFSADDIRKGKAFNVKVQDCYIQPLGKPNAILIPGQPAVFKTDCGVPNTKSNQKSSK